MFRSIIVRLWLIDTGCGQYLVSRRELKYVRKYIKEANKPLTFNTANGKANALEVAELFCNE